MKRIITATLCALACAVGLAASAPPTGPGTLLDGPGINQILGVPGVSSVKTTVSDSNPIRNAPITIVTHRLPETVPPVILQKAEAAAAKRGVPLTPAERTSLYALDSVTQRDEQNQDIANLRWAVRIIWLLIGVLGLVVVILWRDYGRQLTIPVAANRREQIDDINTLLHIADHEEQLVWRFDFSVGDQIAKAVSRPTKVSVTSEPAEVDDQPTQPIEVKLKPDTVSPNNSSADGTAPTAAPAGTTGRIA